MESIRRAIKPALGLATGLALTLSASPASAADTTWEIVPFNQNVCTGPNGGWPPYVLSTVKGTWSTILKTGARNLPAGSTSEEGWIYPGSNDGHTVLGWIKLDLGPMPIGTHHAEIYVTDGKVTQTDTLTITVKARCP